MDARHRHRGDAGTIPEGTVHDLLRDEHRRRVLEHLFENGDGASIQELAGTIAAADRGPEGGRSDERNAVVALRHSHLPKLRDAGVIEYRDGADEATLTDRAAQLRPYLARETGPDGATNGRRGPVEAAVAVLGLCLAALSAAGVVGARTLDPGEWASLALGCVAAIGLRRSALGRWERR